MLFIERRIQILLIALVCCCPITAKHNYRRTHHTENHFFTLGGGAGYSTLFENIPELTTHGNISGTIDFGYEYRLKGFWINLSAELQYLSAISMFNISGTDKLIYDTQGKPALMHYSFSQSLDRQEFLLVNVPFVLGYYYRGLYLGAGAKIGYCISAKESTALQYSTSATYQQYIDDFSAMSDHFYTTHSSSAIEKLNSKYKLSVVAEIGYDVLAYSREMNHAIHSGLKFSLVAEYGLNNIINTNAELPLYSFNEKNASELHIHPFYNANAAQSYRIHPLYVGMRISWIFNIETKKCPRCNVHDNHQNFRKRYNRIQH